MMCMQSVEAETVEAKQPSVASLGLVGVLRGAGLSMLSRGFAARPRARCFFGVLYFRAHSQRETWVSRSTPHGFAYCKSSREQRVGSPAGRYLWCAVYLLLFVLVSRLLGLRI